MLEGMQDWLGFASHIYQNNLYRFFLVNESSERIIKPIRKRFSSDEDKIDEKLESPFKLEIMLSKDSHVVQNFSKFTLADYLIGLGGISRSFYLMGMVIATAASKLFYKQAMILDLFMWQ